MHLAKEQLRKPWIMNCISPPFPALWRIISDIEMHLDLDLDRWHLQSVLPIICYAHKITWILPSIIHPSYLFENGRNQLSLRSSHKSISRYEFWQNKICKVSSKFQFGIYKRQFWKYRQHWNWSQFPHQPQLYRPIAWFCRLKTFIIAIATGIFIILTRIEVQEESQNCNSPLAEYLYQHSN